jgi:hypothetical protein
LAACGSSDSFKNGQQQQSAAPGGADATQQQPAPAAADTSELDCHGITLHDDHQTCDQADVDVAEGKVPTVNNPAPAPASSAPTTAPAGGSGANAAATPGTPPASTTTTGDNTSAATGTSTTAGTTTSTSTGVTTVSTTDPNVIEFHIKAGTGAGSYNTAETPVVVKVGQTLRLFNDDTIAHRLHTSGAPCPHQPGNTAPGASFDCVITKSIDAATTPGAVYDHIAGPSSVFFLKATP